MNVNRVAAVTTRLTGTASHCCCNYGSIRYCSGASESSQVREVGEVRLSEWPWWKMLTTSQWVDVRSDFLPRQALR